MFLALSWPTLIGTNKRIINARRHGADRGTHEQMNGRRRHARNADSLPRLPMMAERYTIGHFKGGHVTGMLARGPAPYGGWRIVPMAPCG